MKKYVVYWQMERHPSDKFVRRYSWASEEMFIQANTQGGLVRLVVAETISSMEAAQMAQNLERVWQVLSE